MKCATVLAALLPLFAGCAEWPPFKSEGRRHFTDKQVAFERLSAKISESKLWRVRTGEVGAVADPDADGVDHHYLIEDDPEWSALLGEVRMSFVAQNEGIVSLGAWSDPFYKHKNRRGFADYLHDPHGQSGLRTCLPEHEEISCGVCAYSLEDGWYIQYKWSPRVLVSKEVHPDLEVSIEEYGDAHSKALFQCRVNGYSQMGYEVDDMKEVPAD